MHTNVIRSFFAERASVLLASAVLLAPLAVACTSLLSACMEWMFDFKSIPPNSVAETLENGLGATRIISALIFAPIVENVFCLLWARFLPVFSLQHGWWSKPSCIATIAAAFHALIFWDIRPIAVFPGFFIISMYIVNSRNKKIGYWASVIHHFCINAINLSLVIIVSD
ncbi:MAG: hypothetical protein QM761_01870 [Pseudoxanthomonas sp.]